MPMISSSARLATCLHGVYEARADSHATPNGVAGSRPGRQTGPPYAADPHSKALPDALGTAPTLPQPRPREAATWKVPTREPQAANAPAHNATVSGQARHRPGTCGGC